MIKKEIEKWIGIMFYLKENHFPELPYSFTINEKSWKVVSLEDNIKHRFLIANLRKEAVILNIGSIISLGNLCIILWPTFFWKFFGFGITKPNNFDPTRLIISCNFHKYFF